MVNICPGIVMLLRSLSALTLPAATLCGIFSLSDLKWQLSNANGSIDIPGKVPSQAHLDLWDAGIITNPLIGINDYTMRWIFIDNWTYSADVTPFTETLSDDPSSKTLLVFYGIDTVANITLFGEPVAWVNNEFRQYVFDVSHIISSSKSTSNKNLTVAIESPVLYSQNVSSRPDIEWDPEGFFEIPKSYPYVRKIASDFGWDWGPAFAPSGIHKNAFFISLISDSKPTDASSSITVGPTIFIEERGIEIHKVGQKPSIPPDQNADWAVNVTLVVRSTKEERDPKIVIEFPELHFISEAVTVTAIPGDTTKSTIVTAKVTVPNGLPELWYPFNLGNPKLYNITVTLKTSNPSNAVSFTTTTGFRTIVLEQAPVPQSDVEQRGIIPGDQFHFEINGKPFYSKGINLIPFNLFHPNTSVGSVRWILESAKASGQNMIRVWGGGTYQPDDVKTGVYDFYGICDELGLLAWSELIFSDNLYPINSFLLENIEPEVRQNVKRIKRHPSLAEWAGGNEIEGIVEGVNTSLANGTHYLDTFVYLFQDFLHDIVLSETSSIAYTDCSTTHGYLSLDPYILRFNNGTAGEIYGNSERYNYDASVAFDYTTYPVSRYVNEFGFLSMPSFYSWEEVLENPEDFSFNSTVVFSRDHHSPAGDLTWPDPNAVQGQSEMTEAVQQWLPTPGTSDSNQTFAQWCWSTQIFQSLNMISEIAFYRRGAGQGENNLGSLVWQLNDVWQGPTWSSIEYSGRWKVLQYGLTNIYSSVVVFPFWTAENQTLEVLVTSDLWEPVKGTVQLTWYDWRGKQLESSKHNFETPSLNNSRILSAVGFENILPKGIKSPNDVWMLLNLTADTRQGVLTHEQYFTPVSLAQVNLIDPEIKITAEPNYTFKLSAQGGVAPFTWIDHPSGTTGNFVDVKTGKPSNGFFLVPGIDKTVQFILNEALSKDVHPNAKDFLLRSLWNNTHT